MPNSACCRFNLKEQPERGYQSAPESPSVSSATRGAARRPDRECFQGVGRVTGFSRNEPRRRHSGVSDASRRRHRRRLVQAIRIHTGCRVFSTSCLGWRILWGQAAHEAVGEAVVHPPISSSTRPVLPLSNRANSEFFQYLDHTGGFSRNTTNGAIGGSAACTLIFGRAGAGLAAFTPNKVGIFSVS